jgi:outer membrane immunogenic protein
MLFRTSASVIALVACTSLAAAADLNGPSYGGSLKDDYAAPAAHNWGGVYIGANLGYAWGDLKVRDMNYTYQEPPQLAGPLEGTAKLSTDGWFGGAQIGYNLQSGRFVIGVEADIQGGDVSDSIELVGKMPEDVGILSGRDIEGTLSADINYFGSVRARLGLAHDRVMPYITGGFAWANVDVDANLTIDGQIDDIIIAKSKSNTHTGWVVGGGIEVALDQNWSLKGEYLYWDFGKETYSFSTVSSLNNIHTISGEADLSFHTFRVGVNYKFGH